MGGIREGRRVVVVVYISSEAAKLELGDNESSHASTGIITERYQSS